jgi:hypothetical protein
MRLIFHKEFADAEPRRKRGQREQGSRAMIGTDGQETLDFVSPVVPQYGTVADEERGAMMRTGIGEKHRWISNFQAQSYCASGDECALIERY